MQQPPPGYGPPRPGMINMMQPPMGFSGAPLFNMGPPQMAPPGMMMRPPPQMLRPPPLMPRPIAPTLPKPTGAGPSLGRPAAAVRCTTLYVGKIAPSLEDSVVRTLLESCGPVASWKRMQDSDGRPKGFGFCEFEEADGVVRALRHLSNLAIDGQELLLKCSAATQQYVDEFVARKAVESAARKAAAEEAKSGEDTEMSEAGGAEGGADLPPPPATGDPEVVRDNEVLEKIMTIVSDRAAVSTPQVSVDAASFLTRMGAPGPAVTPPHQSRSEAPTSTSYASRADERVRSRDRQPDDRDSERMRASERKEAEARATETERLYRDRLSKLEKRERERLRDVERQHEKEAAAEKDRARQVRADITAVDEAEDDLPAWQRRPVSTTRRAEERRRRRVREQEDDAADRAAEAHQKRLRLLDGAASPSGSDEAQQNGHALPQLNAAPEARMEPSDPIYRAMIAAARAPAVKGELMRSSTASGSTSVGSGVSAGLFGKQAAKRNKSALAAAFGGEDEDEVKPRELKKLNYSAEEIAAAQAQPVAISAAVPAPQNSADSKELMKRIVERMPSDRAGVFAYLIDWAAYDALPVLLQGKISTWVCKTIKEMLGEEEQTLVEHVMEKLREHCAPAAMLEEMKEILDTDAEKFVLKMYRFVIYESEKQKLVV